MHKLCNWLIASTIPLVTASAHSFLAGCHLSCRMFGTRHTFTVCITCG